MGFVSFLGRSILVILGFSVFLVIPPGIHPYGQLQSFHITQPKAEYLQKVDSNEILDEAELFYEGDYPGMESLVELPDGSIVTGDESTGMIFRISEQGKRSNVTQLRCKCPGLTMFRGVSKQAGQSECGMPLGMRLDLDGNPIFMDVIGGMTKVDLKTGQYEALVPKDVPIDGKIGHISEDLDIARDGTIYWSHGATSEDFIGELLGERSGRLIQFDRATKTHKVLIDGLHFANGVQLSENEDFVLVSDFGSARIRRYILKGDKIGTSDIFVDGLPGYVDNIRSNGRGGFYAALWAPWSSEFSLRTHLLSGKPLLRKFILRLRNVINGVLHFIEPFVPKGNNIYWTDFSQYLQVLQVNLLMSMNEVPKKAMVVELSETGEVLRILNGNLANLSQLTVGKKYAYLAAPYDNKIWRVKVER